MKKTILITGALCFWTVTAPAGDIQVGRYTHVEGRADVLHEHHASAVRIKTDDPVYLADIVRTKSNSRVEITFSDESVLRLAASSRAGIEKYSFGEGYSRQEAAIKLYRGKIRAIVSSKGDSRSFDVFTPSARGTVKGTDIFAFHQADTTGILVKEGGIRVFNPAFPDKTAYLGAGEFVSIPRDGEPGALRAYVRAELEMHKGDTEPVFARHQEASYEDMAKIRGMVISASGDVKVFVAGQKDRKKAIAGMILAEGDKITTGADGRVGIGLENGNALSLQSDSEIIIKVMRQDRESGEYNNTFESDYGEIKAVIEKLGAKSTFKVKTPQAVCAVRGTVMYLNISQASTDVYYEGGGGEVTSTISGESMLLEAGQNTSADSFGNVSAPLETTGEQRMDLDETWDAGKSAEGYSDPGNDPASRHLLAGGDTATGAGPVTDDILKKLNDETTDPAKLGEVPPTAATLESSVTATEVSAFSGGFGQVSAFRSGEAEFTRDDATSVKGDFAFSIPASGGKWGGISDSGNSVWGDYSNRGVYTLWGCDTDHTASDGGRMTGKTGGTMTGDSMAGKAFGLYVDSSGHGGTYSAFFKGISGGGEFSSDGTEEVHFTSRSYLGIAPADMHTLSVNEGDLAGGKGLGSFSGGAGGAIECLDLAGGEKSFDGYDWGMWWMQGEGTFESPTGDDWKLALGGQSGDTEGGHDAWVGTVNGSKWNSGSFEGVFMGAFFHAEGDQGDVTGGNIFNGHFLGSYSEETFTWEALGGGEWVEVTDLLSEINLGFTMAEFENFVTVPITEAYCSLVRGTNANLDLSMDIRLYHNELANIWTSPVSGEYSGEIADNWNLTLTNTSSHQVTLTGQKWSDGQWHALVSGAVDGITLTGEAAGKYTDAGSVEGVAGGTWSNE